MTDINELIAQRDQLQQILVQRDNTIEHLMSKQKLEKMSISQTRLPEKTVAKNGTNNSNEQTDNHLSARISQSPTKIKYEHLTLECRLLKGLNKSLENENENLKTVNKILQNNFDIISERLERVQSHHQLSLSQLHDASQSLKKSVKSIEVGDSLPDNSKLFFPKTKYKRRRRADIKIKNCSKRTVCIGQSGTEYDCSDDDMDEIDDSDRMDYSGENTEDDVIYVG